MNATEELTLVLPCPDCGENLLEKGFYNYCTETTSLREDNYTLKQNGRVYMDHDENGHETTDHECALDAYCRNCETLLPWPLYELRALDGEYFADAEKMIADLMAEIKQEDAAESDSEDAEEEANSDEPLATA